MLYKKVLKILFFSLLLFVSAYSFNVNSNENIKKYLQGNITFYTKVLKNSAFEKISNAQIFEAGIHFGYTTSRNYLFLKYENNYLPIFYKNDIVFLPEFLKSLNNKFLLKTDEDAVLLQTVFFFLDEKYSDKGFFKKDNDWYFIRKKFFDDIEGYKVVTEKNGKILQIESIDKNFVIPDMDENNTEGKRIEFTTDLNQNVDKADSLYLANYILPKFPYKYEVLEKKLTEIKLPNNVNLYEATLIIDEFSEDYTSQSKYSDFILNVGEEYYQNSAMSEIVQSKIFLDNVASNYNLKSNNDAKKFEKVLDELVPIIEEDALKNKKHYKKENLWIFVREKSFDDLKGYIVLTNASGKIIAISYRDINEKEFLRVKMLDENFNIDYGFKLIAPKNSVLTITEGSKVEVEIKYNNDYVNASSAWIMTYYKGEMVGVYAGTDMKSPFGDSIPSEILTVGKHIIEYILMPPGDDISKAFDRIAIEITVIPKK